MQAHEGRRHVLAALEADELPGLAVLQQFANSYLNGTGDFIVVILLAVVLLVRPSGILGRKA